MTKIEEMSELMIELIESVNMTSGAMKLPKRVAEIVREIADYSRQTKLYQEHKEESESFWQIEDATPEKIWIFILEKVVNAPTSLHRHASIILHMPTLDSVLNKTERCRICGCTWDNACIGGCSWVAQ